MSEQSPLILVVDDEPDICELIKDILNDEGYQAVSAANGVEARKAFSTKKPDLILLDIWMPDIDGISLLKEFKQLDTRMTIIMMSGHGTIETAIEATRLGAADFIEKPVSIAKLLRSIESAIEKDEKQVVVEQTKIVEPIGKAHN
ncbi:MAG: response regulator [Gammaproteobacteria bacterium]|nr:response regulator [Gammaproteobacteria bacterium]